MALLIRNALGVLGICLILSACSEGDDREILGVLDRDRITLSATETELVTAVHVAEGQKVKEGDILVELNPAKHKATLAAAKASLQEARKRLEELKNGSRAEEIRSGEAQVASAQATLKGREQAFARAKVLVQRQAVDHATLDAAKAAMDSAKANVDQAKAQLDLLKAGTRTEVIEQAQEAVKAAEEQVRYQQELLDDLTFKATRDGLVDALPWKKGERVKVGTPVVVLLAGASPYVRAYLPATDRLDVSAGVKLNVHVEGSDKVWKGTVRSVRSEPAFTPYYALNAKDRSHLMYLIEVDLGADAADLPSGLPAQVMLP